MLSHTLKRSFSLLLAILMVFSCLPTSAMAAEEDHVHYDAAEVAHSEAYTRIQSEIDRILEQYLDPKAVTSEEIQVAVDASEDYYTPLDEVYFLEIDMEEQLTEAEAQELLANNPRMVPFAEALYARFYAEEQEYAVYASKTVTVLDGKVSITDDNGTGSVSGGTVTITAKGSLFSKKTNNITVKNASDAKAQISFDYNASSATSFKIAGTSATASGSYSVALEAGASVSIVLVSNSGLSNTTATLTMSNFKLVAVNENSNVTFVFDGTLGSMTAGGTAVENGAVQSVSGTTGVELKATAKSGSNFLGWVDADGKILSTAATYTLVPAQDMTVKAAFAKDGGVPWFGVGVKTQQSESTGLLGMSKLYYYTVAVDHLYDNLSAATAAASGKAVVLMNNATLPAGDHTIPAGVDFLIPFNDSNTLYTTAVQAIQLSKYAQPTAYRTLTLADGANLIVNGGVSVSAKHAFTQGSQPHGTAPIETVGFIKMQGNSKITVNNGGALYAYGFITGSGSVIANSGAKVYELFQVADFRGGDQTSSMKNGVFPMAQYYAQNIEVPLTLYSGAAEYAVVSIYASKTAVCSAIEFIGSGSSSAMFRLTSGYIVKDYDEAADRLNITVAGNVSIAAVTIDTGLKSIDSSGYNLAINGNMTVHVKSGATTINQNLALLPGSEFIIDSGATVNLGKNCNVFIYDKDQWGNYCGAVNAVVVPVVYAPGRTYTRSTALEDQKDASICVNGTINASAGGVYTTEGGANIYSTGTGIFITTAGTIPATYQMTQAADTSNSVYTQIPITYAKLKHGDGNYLTSGTNTYVYNSTTGKWECSDNAEIGGKGHTDTAPVDGTCDVCGFVMCEHANTTSVTVDATCTEDGSVTVTCTGCGTVMSTETLSATGHTAGTAATCTTAQTCTVCSAVLNAATGHSFGDTTAAKDATCTESGNYAYKQCTACNLYFAGNATTDATDGATVADGFVIPQLAHDFEGQEWTTSEKKHWHICKNCTATDTQEDHIEGEPVVETVLPTDTQDGKRVTTISCTVCGRVISSETEILPAVGGGPDIDDNVSSGNSCTDGHVVIYEFAGPEYHAGTCSRCGERVFEAHSTEAEDDTPATCEDPAYCSVCDSEYGEPAAHTYEKGYYYYDEDDGEAGHYPECDHCDFVDETVAIEAHMDNNNDGACDRCQFEVGHIHTYEEGYYHSDETYHYPECDQCDVYDESRREAHEDLDNDGNCDVCDHEVVHTHNYVFVETVDPTCADYGYDLYECGCGATEERNVQKATGEHDFSCFIEGEDATCEDDGYEIYECQNCDEQETKVLKAPGHSKQYKDLENGKHQVTCENCDLDTTEDHTFDPETHKCACGATRIFFLVWKVDGKNYKQETVAYGAALAQIDEPTKEGFTFSGWSELPATMPAHNVEVTGTFTVNTYTVTWIVDGVETVETYAYGATIVEPTDPTKTGYTFQGWGKEIPATMPAENLTFTAAWEINTYTISWDTDGDGDVDETTAVTYGQLPTHADPTKAANGCTSYTFNGWSPALAEVTGNVTYTATYTATTVHSYGDWKTVIPATCTQVGSEKRTCACGDEETQEIPATNHQGTIEERPQVDATCVAAGIEAGTYCTACKNYISGGATIEIDPDAHSFTRYTHSSNASCGVNAKETATCDRDDCDATDIRDIEGTAWQHVFEGELKDLENGKHAWKCTNTGCEVYGNETAHTFGDWQKDATNHWKECACGAKSEEAGHDWTDATCTAPKTCSVCNATAGEALGHDFTGPLTALDVAEKHGNKCVRCNAIGNAVDHSYDFVSNDDGTHNYACKGCNTTKVSNQVCEDAKADHKCDKCEAILTACKDKLRATAKKPATCNEAGYEAYWTCNICSKLYSDANAETEIDAPVVIPAGHNYGELVHAKNPVHTAEKLEAGVAAHYRCSECGTYFTQDKKETTLADLTGETPAHSWTDATCTAPKTCKTCGKTEGEALNHIYETYVNNGETHSLTCNACGAVDPNCNEADHYFDVNKGHECVCGKIGSITVIWQNEDGSELKTIEVIFGTDYQDQAPEAPTKAATAEYTYTFSHWKETKDANDNVTYEPVFTETANSYIVKWMDGDTVVKKETLDYGAEITKPDQPDKEGYTFNGWDGYTTGMTMPAKDVTFTAKWQVNSYTITWMNGEEVFATTEVNYGEAITAPVAAPEKDKAGCSVYTFTGWSAYPVTMPAEDLTVTAQFSTAEQHNWSETAEYIWTIDGENTTCTAKLVCKDDQTHYREAQAVKVEKVTVETSTCTKQGVFHYKATFNVEWAADNEYAIDYTLGFAPHTIVKVEAKAATCTEGGNVAHWQCSACEKRFKDENGTDAYEDESWKTTDPDNHTFENNICTGCGLGKCGENLYWTLVDGVLTFTGSGAMTDYTYSNQPPWYSRAKGKIKEVVFDCEMTHIGARAFTGNGFSNITSMILPDTIVSIGEMAFHLSELTSISLPASLEVIGKEAFYCSYNLADVTLPSNLKVIGASAFALCNGVEEFYIPKTVNSIGEGAFDHAVGLQKIVVDVENEYYSNDEFGVLFDKEKTVLMQYPAGRVEELYVVPDTVKTICAAFKQIDVVSNIEIPASVETIQNGAFYGNTGLKTVTIAGGAIGENAFEGCTALTKVEFVQGNISIGECAFKGCTALESVVIPECISATGRAAFGYCTGLKTVEIHAKKIDGYAFTNCISLMEVIIHDGVETITREAFYECPNLQKITIPASVNKIGFEAFYNCMAINEVNYYGTKAQWEKLDTDGSKLPSVGAEGVTFNFICDLRESHVDKDNDSVCDDCGESLGVAQIGDQVYATLTEALEAAKEMTDPVTITLLANIEGKVTISQVVTIDKGEFTFEYTIEGCYKAEMSEDGKSVEFIANHAACDMWEEDVSLDTMTYTLVTRCNSCGLEERKPMTVPKIVKGPTVTIEESLAMSFRLDAAYVEQAAYLVIVRKDVQGNHKETRIYNKDEWVILANGRAEIYYKNIVAKAMADKFYVYACDSNGVRISNIQLGGIRQYTEQVFAAYKNNLDNKLVRLCVDLLNYGAASQILFDGLDPVRDAELLANYGLSEELKNCARPAPTLDEIEKMVNQEGTADATGFKGMTITLGNAIIPGIQFLKSFTGADVTKLHVIMNYVRLDGSEHQIIIHGSDGKTEKGYLYSNKSDRWLVEFYGISAVDGSSLLSCKLYESDDKELTESELVASGGESTVSWLARQIMAGTAAGYNVDAHMKTLTFILSAESYFNQ